MDRIILILCLFWLLCKWIKHQWEPSFDIIEIGDYRYLIVWYDTYKSPIDEAAYRDYKIILRLWH